MYTQVLGADTQESTNSSFPEIDHDFQKDLVQVFKLFADETRVKILFMLIREGELHVSALCDRLEQSQPAVSHHLALLRVAGVIEARRDGKHNFYSVRKQRFADLFSTLFDAITEESDDDRVHFENLMVSKN